MSIEDSDAEPVLRLYNTAFPDSPTKYDVTNFRSALTCGRIIKREYRNHLWSLTLTPDRDVIGFALFSTYPGVGYGAYMALDPSVRGKGLTRSVISMMEKQMIEDDFGAKGWFIECEDQPAVIFSKLGFLELDITYRQPPVDDHHHYDIHEAPILHLLYKPFEALRQNNVQELTVSINELLHALEWIYAKIYDFTDRFNCPYYQDIVGQLGKRNLDNIPFIL